MSLSNPQLHPTPLPTQSLHFSPSRQIFGYSDLDINSTRFAHCRSTILMDLRFSSFELFQGDPCTTKFLSLFATMFDTHSVPFNNLYNTGTFKECYYAEVPGFIIKFCTEQDNTHIEEKIFRLAAKHPCQPLFLDTIFVPLPFSMPARHLEATPTEGGDLWYQSINYCQIQPFVEMAANHGILDPIYFNDGEPLNPELLAPLDLIPSAWIVDAIKYHGDAAVRSLFDFAALVKLRDLHLDNLGYLVCGADRKPVIIDWVSGG